MPQTKIAEATELPEQEPAVQPKTKTPAQRQHAGTDIEAFYAAQKEAARASREYAARRRQR